MLDALLRLWREHNLLHTVENVPKAAEVFHFTQVAFQLFSAVKVAVCALLYI